MTHYEERLEADLNEIKDRVRGVADAVAAALAAAEHALLSRDRSVAARTILGDHPINRETREIDRLCHAFVARHLPSAGHLRFVSSVLRIDVELERIGDYAVSICREAVQLSQPLTETIAGDLKLMAEQGRTMFSQSVQAFIDDNTELARGTKGMADQTKVFTQKVWRDLLAEGESGSRPIADLFAVLLVLNRLERITAQAKNICEETIFAGTGQTKEPKVYSVLFLDESNSLWSQMAEVIARKTFPGSGRYSSAGRDPASHIEEATLTFLRNQGLDFEGLQPKALDQLQDDLASFDVIVGVGCDPFEILELVPFHSTATQWERPAGDSDLQEGSKALGLMIRELMETLRGTSAD
jgi:phosphate transport system protein